MSSPPALVLRRFAAILAADIAGYSSIMGQDEEGTARALEGHREAIFPIIAQHGGRILGQAGDGFLAEFPEPDHALHCARVIQSLMQQRNAGIDPGMRLQFRIGLHLGDVLEHQQRLYGDCINIAARLEGLAEPGGICLSEAVRAALGDAVPAALRDRGEQSLKNIARRVHVFELPPPPGCSPAASSARAAVHGDHGSERPSLAVLPFKTIGGDGSQDYFAEGLGEELTTALSKFGWLRIIAANSSRAVHQYTPDARAAAAALEVRFVLQGSVRLGGNRVRVAAHLVDAASGTQVWSERYDRAIADIFEIQDDITQHIVSELSSEITVAEIERVHRQRPVNLSAWDAYLRALPLLRDHTEASNARAAELLRNAIERAPGLACAWARLSACEVQAAYYNWSGSTQARVQRAIDLARRAYALDPREPLALDALASAYQFVGDAENAARTAAQALEISPTCAAAYGTLVTSLAFLGRIEEAKRVVERSRRSNPRDPDSAALTFGLVVISFLEGDYERAAQTARAYIAMRPNWYGGHQYLTAACALGGHLAEAQQAAGALLRSRPGFSLAQYRSEARLRRPEDLGRVVEGLRLAGIPEGDAS